MSTFYPQNDYRGYLSHHGIKGQKWGEQNGPPYPLSTKVHNMVVRGRLRRAAKRREKILHDPRKLVKHAPEFTKEEIDEAIAKIDSIDQARKRIKPTAKETLAAKRAEAAQKHSADSQLAKKIDKYGPNAAALEKNTDKFTNDELREAAARVGIKHDIYNKKMSELDRPRKFLQVGSDLLGTIATLFGNANRIKEVFEPKYDPDTGLTKEEKRHADIYKKVKNNPEMLELFSVAVPKLGDSIRKNQKGRNAEKVETFESFFRSGLESGDLDIDDLPNEIRSVFEDEKWFKNLES